MGVSLHDPQGIAIHHDQMFIADGGNGRILKYQRDTRGNFQPILATQTGLMDLPQGLAYDDAGKNSLLFVVCGRMNRVHVLDAGSLRRLFSFGGETEPDPRAKKMPVSCLNDPTCIAIYNPPEMALDAPGVFGGRARKLAYVTDTENDRLAVFSMDGDFVAAVGRNGRMPGEFVEPLGLCIRDQQLFVAEGGRGIGGRLQVLQPDGTPLLVLPAPTGGRLVGVHWHESRLYVSEIEAHRLHSFKIVA
jgi:sugar lactone lactonase YvrE